MNMLDFGLKPPTGIPVVPAKRKHALIPPHRSSVSQAGCQLAHCIGSASLASLSSQGGKKFQ